MQGFQTSLYCCAEQQAPNPYDSGGIGSGLSPLHVESKSWSQNYKPNCQQQCNTPICAPIPKGQSIGVGIQSAGAALELTAREEQELPLFERAFLDRCECGRVL